MLAIKATDARKNWSEMIDRAIRLKPQFIKRTRDNMILADVSFMESILAPYEFSAETLKEDDGSYTISLNEIDLVENADNLENAKMKLAKSILEYSEDFYEEFKYWSSAPNRVDHIPYVFKALIKNDPQKIGDMIRCQAGKT